MPNFAFNGTHTDERLGLGLNAAARARRARLLVTIKTPTNRPTLNGSRRTAKAASRLGVV